MDAVTTSTLSALISASTDAPASEEPGPRHGNQVVAFIIGLSIILLASIMNAAGLNLTKLDHVRSSLLMHRFLLIRL